MCSAVGVKHYSTVCPCKALKVMYGKGVQTCFGARSRTETCDSSLEPALKCGFNALEYVQVAQLLLQMELLLDTGRPPFPFQAIHTPVRNMSPDRLNRATCRGGWCMVF
jgi:hypothetical protein